MHGAQAIACRATEEAATAGAHLATSREECALLRDRGIALQAELAAAKQASAASAAAAADVACVAAASLRPLASEIAVIEAEMASRGAAAAVTVAELEATKEDGERQLACALDAAQRARQEKDARQVAERRTAEAEAAAEEARAAAVARAEEAKGAADEAKGAAAEAEAARREGAAAEARADGAAAKLRGLESRLEESVTAERQLRGALQRAGAEASAAAIELAAAREEWSARQAAQRAEELHQRQAASWGSGREVVDLPVWGGRVVAAFPHVRPPPRPSPLLSPLCRPSPHVRAVSELCPPHVRAGSQLCPAERSESD